MIPLLVANEKGLGQTESPLERGVEMWWRTMAKVSRKSLLERSASEGDSPVFEDTMLCSERVGLPGLGV